MQKKAPHEAGLILADFNCLLGIKSQYYDALQCL